MFDTGTRVISRCTAFFWREGNAGIGMERPTNQSAPAQDLPSQICRVLAEMLPSTAEEIAESAGLDRAMVSASLEELTRRYRVMFNPLTKRFSLPRAPLDKGIVVKKPGTGPLVPRSSRIWRSHRNRSAMIKN